MLLAGDVDDVPPRLVRHEGDALRSVALNGTLGPSHAAPVPVASHFEREVQTVLDNRNDDGGVRGKLHVPTMLFLTAKGDGRLERGRRVGEGAAAVGCRSRVRAHPGRKACRGNRGEAGGPGCEVLL